MMISKKILICAGVTVALGVVIGFKLTKKYKENKLDGHIDDFDGDDDIEYDDVVEEKDKKNNVGLANSIGIGMFDGNAVKRDMEEYTNEDPFIAAVNAYEKDIIESFDKNDDKNTQNTIKVSNLDTAQYSLKSGYDIEQISQALKEHMECDDIQTLIGQGETKLGLSLLVSKPDLSLDVEFDDEDYMTLYNNGEQVILYDYNEDQYKFILDREGDTGKLYGYIVNTEFPSLSDSFIKNGKPTTANLSKVTNDDFLTKLRITDYDPDDIDEIGHLKVYDYNVLLTNYVAFCKDSKISSKSTFPVFLK